MSSSAPTVSVVVPTFRSAGFLHRALTSLQAQTHASFEVVVIDNCSEDESHLVAQRMAGRDPRFRAFRQDRNFGPVRNWVAGLERTTSQRVALLFSDDWYEPDFLKTACRTMDTNGAGVFVSPAKRRVAREAGLEPVEAGMLYPSVQRAGFSGSDYLRDLLLPGRAPLVPVSPGCAVFDRELLLGALALSLPDPVRCDYAAHGAGPDLWCYALAALNGVKFAGSSVPLVNFMDRASAESHKPAAMLGYLWAKRLVLDALPAGFSWRGRAEARWWRQAVRVSLQFPRVVRAALGRRQPLALPARVRASPFPSPVVP